MSGHLKLIAVETSGKVGRLALALGGRTIDEREITSGMRHGRRLLALLDEAVRQAGWSPSEVGLIAVSIGPGSFTGLRIAVMFARTAAWVTGARIVAVPTLRVVAAGAPAEARHVAAVTDAQRGGLYWAVYRRDDRGDLSATAPEAVGPPETVVRSLPAEAVLVGDALGRYPQVFAGRPQTDPSLWTPRASVLAQLGWAMHLRGEHTAADRLEPLYVRRPAPEEVAERRKRGGR